MTEEPDKDPDSWETRDGRVLKLEEMAGPHIENARACIRKWAKGEEDPELRRELRSWVSRFGREARRRRKEWEARRHAKP